MTCKHFPRCYPECVDIVPDGCPELLSPDDLMAAELEAKAAHISDMQLFREAIRNYAMRRYYPRNAQPLELGGEHGES